MSAADTTARARVTVLRTANGIIRRVVSERELRDAERQSYAEGYAAGRRRVAVYVSAWWFTSGTVCGFIAGALLRHLLGPLS